MVGVEVYLIVTGLVFFIWLFALVRQTQRGFSADQIAPPRPVVPINLMESDEAVVVAEGRGRIVYVNDSARDWFGIDGGAPSLALITQVIQPADTFHDLLATAGHASLRLGQRQIEAVSHAIPGPTGPQMVVVMRELTGDALSFVEFDPMRALAILDDISRAIGTNLDLFATLDSILESVGQSIQFDSAEVTVWHPETETLRPVGRNIVRTSTGTLIPPEERSETVYRMGEGYSGWIAMYRQPLLINNVSGRTDIFPKSFHGDFQSFVGVPLVVGDQFVGTLELTHHERNAFSPQDLSLLRAIDGQVASAIQAAQLYHAQTSRVTELDGLQQIAQAMGQLDTPAALYGQLSERIAHLVNVQICGVLLYDSDKDSFRSQPPFYGVPDSLVQHYRLTLIQGSELYTIWHNRPYWYSNAPQVELIRAMGFEDLSSAVSITTMALVPMIVGTRRIGLLMVANRRDDRGFDEDDMHMLMSFASQAAVVAENERLYHEEQRRNRELGGLQQIAQTMGVLRNPEELYGQITERIATLMGVEMCGILLYDTKQRVLISQQPFYGMDDVEQIGFYQLPSPPDSPVAQLWQARDTWFSNDLRRDPLAQDSDLVTLASQVGIRHTVLATLFVGTNRIGIIQASNRRDTFDFTEDDARVLSIFAGQAAILIDNARLYREMQQRTHEAEGLRAVTEIVSQATPDDETVEQVLVAIANLLQVRVVTLALVDESTGDLVLRTNYVWGATLPKEVRIDTYAPGFAESVLISRQSFVSQDVRTDERMLDVYKTLAQQLKLRDLIQVPLVIRDRSIGELTVANRTEGDPFGASDVQLLNAMGTQIAAMVDRMRLYQATDQDLRARIQELDALSRVSHELSQTLELDRILDVIRQEALRSTDASAASIVLLLLRKDWASDDEPVIERRFGEGRALRELAPVELAAVLRNDILTVEDYNDSEFEAQPPKTRSALVVPINYGEEVIGLIHMFSANPSVFDQSVIDFALALTDQATVAIGNARRYQDQLQLNERLRIRAERMGRIFELGEMFRQGTPLAEMLEEVAHSIQETVGFNVVLISLLDERENVLRRTAQAGLPLAVFEEMQKIAPPLEQARSLMQDEFKVSSSYFLPAEGAEELRDGLPVYKGLTEPMGEGPRAWDPEDLLLVPLYGAGGRLIGMISVDEPHSGQRPDVNTVEALEIFSNQAAFSIENYRLIERIREEAEATRRERDRLAQLHLVASEIQSAPDVPSRLQVVADGIHDAGWGHVVITLHDEHLEPTALIQSGYDPDEAMTLSDEVLPGSVWREWINDLDFHALKLGAGYYLRYDNPWVRKHALKDVKIDPPQVPADDWHPQDVFYLPLVGQDQKRIIGMIAMDTPVGGEVPTEATLQPFELFASQAAAAIETTRLYLETVRAAEQEQRLNEVMAAVSGSISPDAIIQAVGRGLQQMVPFTRMGLAMHNTTAERFDILHADIALDTSVTVRQGEPREIKGTAMGQVLREMKSRIVQLGSDESSRETCDDLKSWYETGEHSTLLVPMIAGGQSVGVLHLGSELENAFGFEENLELIQRLANLSAVALDNARLFAEAQERAVELDAQARRLALINRIANQLARALDADEIYGIALREMQEALGAQYGSVVIYESAEVGRVILDTHPDAPDDGTLELSLVDNLQVVELRETMKPIASEDVMSDKRFKQVWPLLEPRDTKSLLLVPLLISRQVVGSVGLDFTETHPFNDAETELAETIASQVSVALEKTNLLSEAERRAIELNAQAQRLAALNRMSERLAGSLDPQEIYQIVLEDMQTAVGVQSCGLMLLQDDDTAKLVLSTHPMDQEQVDISIPLKGNPVAEYIIETHKPYVAEDLLNDERFRFMWDMQRARNTAAMLIVPVLMGERLVGTIGLDSAEPRAFSEVEIELAMTAANQAAVAIEKARLFTEAQRHATEMDEQAQRLVLVNSVSTRLAQTLDQQEIYETVLRELQDILHLQFGGFLLFGEDEGRLVADTHPDFVPGEYRTMPLEGNPSIRKILDTHQPLVSEDVLNDPLFEPVWDQLRERGTRSLMVIPMLVGEVVIGTIGLDSTEPRQFTPAEIGLAETIANQAALAVEKARLYDETLGLTIFNQAVVESIQQGIVVLDSDLRVVRVNRYMIERYGWSMAAVNEPLFDYRPDYADFLREPIAVALAIGEPQGEYEVERQDESGATSVRNYYIYPMHEAQQVTGIVLLLEDVTERARLEADLQTRAVQMAALSEVSGQITSTLEPEQVIELVLDALARVVPYNGVSLWLRAPGEDELHIVAARGYEDPDATGVDDLIGLTVEIQYSPLFAEMAANRQVIHAPDVAADPERFPYGSEAVYKNWLGAPLVSGSEVIGVLAVEKREPHFYNPLYEQLALTFASQAAVALNNARLFQETRARATALTEQAQRLALLNRVSLALAQTLDIENIYEIALREAAIALDVTEGSAIQIDATTTLATAVVDYPRGDMPPDLVFDATRNAAIDRVRDNLFPLVVEQDENDPLAESLRVLLRRDDVVSSLLVPLVVGGEVIGMLRLDSLDEEHQFRADQIELAQTIASQAATAAQNAALFEQGQIRTSELETLFESAQATAVTLDLDEVVRRVTVQMLTAVGADACTVFIWDEVNNRIEVRGDVSARPEDAESDQPGDIHYLDDYPLREQALTNREMIIVRGDDDSIPQGERDLLAKHHAASRMLIPLVVNEISIGLVELEMFDPNRFFKAETARLARTLASQAAISIENARLQTETRRTVEELYIINDMSGALAGASNVEELLAVLDLQLPSLTDAEVLYVALYDPILESISFPLAAAVREDKPLDLLPLSLGNDEFSLIIKQRAPLLLAGGNLGEVRRSLGIETVMEPTSGFVGVPLFGGDEIVGVLAARDDTDPLAFTHNDQRILNTVGAQLGVAIQSTRLFQQTLQLAEELDQRVQDRTRELEHERQHISTLYRITTELATSLDMEKLLGRALEMVADAVSASQGAILAVDPIANRLSFSAVMGWDEVFDEDGESPSLRLNEGLAGWAIQQRQGLIVENVQEDPRWLRLGPADDIPRAAMVAPIESTEDILGVMMLFSETPGAFSQDQLRLVTAAASQVANAMNNAELYSLIRDQAERLGAMLREQQVEATKSEAILDSVADGVMVADQTGGVILFNQAASRVLRVPAEDAIGRPTSEIAGLYGAGTTRWAVTAERWMADPAAYEPGNVLDEEIRLEDERIINVRLAPVQMGDQFLGTVSIIRDITREVEVDRLKSEFVATVSHELRTPMTSIKGYADLLLLGAAGVISDQQQRFLETIKINADRLSRLVNDLLDISRIDQGRMELRFNLVEVDDLLNAMADHVRGRTEDEKRTMNVIVDLPEDEHVMVWGDYEKITQILTNLVDNAFNYTPEGGTITLSAVPAGAGDESILQVSDTGIGIPPEAADRVFERFFRGDETHDLVMDTPGTGLGLAIVKELVEVHRGDIWFESEVGQGTTFFVKLPARATEQLVLAAELGAESDHHPQLKQPEE